jgi:MFS family permease
MWTAVHREGTMARAEKRAQAGPATTRPRLVPDLTALGFRDYRLLWSGMLAMSALMPLQFTTLLLYLQAAAPEDVRLILAGLLGAMRGGVMLIAGIPGGALADRFDRRRLLLVTQSVAIVANAGVAVLMLFAGAGAASLAAIFALTFVAAGAMTVDAPTRQALVPQLVPREQLATAIALDAVAMQLAFPLSLPLTGILIDRLGFGGAFAASLLGHLTVLLMVVQIRVRGRVAAGGRRASMLVQIREGFRYTRNSPIVLWLIVLLLAVMAIAFPPVGSLGPVWVTQVLDLSPAQFGFFGAMWGLGAVIASIAMTSLGHFPRKGWLVAGGAIVFATGVIVWGYSRSVLLSGAVNLALGASLAMMQVSARSLVQRIVPNEIQGRVLSLFMLNMGLAQFMSGPVGALAQAFTLERIVPVLGWISLTLTAGIVLLRPDIRRAGYAVQSPTATGDG